ncbi:hypothetical protein [Gordonia alkaliphila]|uniref:DNA-3-methyladenine glycosylase 2 family protein n=1 Tax=Gordonia alkaliphila TaxID=1053547 RepID=A0ABP8ZG66_9ACTN
MERRWRPPEPLDVDATLRVHRHGGRDPAYRRAPDGSVWRASYTPDGPGTVTVVMRAGEVAARAWGPGAGWLLDRFPDSLGAQDDPDSLPIDTPVLAQLAARARGLRIGRSDRVWEALASIFHRGDVLACAVSD